MNWRYDPSLVLYLPLWRLEGGNIKSADAYGHRCTVTGATRIMQGYSFDGSDDKIDVPVHAALDISAAFTVMVWVKVNTISLPVSNAIFCKRDIQGVQPFLLYSETTSGWTFVVSANGLTWGTVIQSTTRHNTTDWHFLAAAHNGALATLDIDELVAVGSDTTPANAQTGTGFPFIIGKRGGDQNLNGSIGEIMIFNKWLTPMQRQAIFRETKGRYR